MTKEELKLLIEKIKLQIKILQIQLRIALLKEKLTVPNLPDPKYIVVHHSASNETFEQVNEYHKQKWGLISSLGYGIGYQYFIEYSGKVYQGRRDNEEGAHCVEANRPGFWNKNSIGICLQGNFEEMEPTTNQLIELKKLIDKKKTEYNITDNRIFGHREISPTLCPGQFLFQWLTKNYPS